MLSDVTDNPFWIFNEVAWGIAVVVGVLIAVLGVWACCYHFIWRARRGLANRQAYRRKHGPDGKAYPPVGKGICSACQQARQEVFHLPSGERLCKNCYDNGRESDQQGAACD